jgi:putative ABC transport system permease protein
MGIAPAIGRAALPSEDDESAQAVVLLSHTFWMERFGGSSAALGQSMMLDGESFTIVGVMPEGFTLPAIPDDRIWPVLRLAKPEYRAPFWLRTFARLAPSATPERARAELASLAASVKERYPDSPPHWNFSLVDLRTLLVKDVRSTVLILYGAVALILLMAVANASSLFLTRASARMPELAIRSALGAGRRRIVRQLVTESTVVGILGGVVGVLIAIAGVRTLVAAAPAGVPRLEDVRIDWIVLLVTAALSIIIGVLVGLIPALMVPRQALDAGIREGGRGVGISGARHRVRNAMVIGEFALALTVIVAAALVTDSLMRLQRVDPGMRPEGVLATRVAIPAARYPEPANVEAFYDDVLRRVKALPGVADAALSMAVPPNRLVMRNPYTPEGKIFASGESAPVAQHILVSPEYFSTLGIPVVRGRGFTDADRAESPSVAIVSETFARRAFPGKEPVGRWFQMGDPNPESPRVEVVGVVPDVKYAGLEAEDAATFYVPYRQSLWWRNMYIVLRTDGDPTRHAPGVRAAVAAVDPQVGLLETRTIEGLMSESVAVPRYRARLLGAFALLALLLASAGIYAVMSYSVTQRRRETGVRLALGATPRAVLMLVVTDGLRLAALGVIIGVGLAMATTRWLSSLLYEVSPLDPASFAGTALFLALVAVFASAWPAWRASRTDPMQAIRVE